MPDSDQGGKPKDAPEQVEAEIATGNGDTETQVNLKTRSTFQRPFNLWAQQHRAHMMKKKPDAHYNQVAKMLGAQWRALPESEKFAYVEDAKMRGLTSGNDSKESAEVASQQNESWEDTLETEDPSEDDDDDSHFIEAL